MAYDAELSRHVQANQKSATPQKQTESEQEVNLTIER